MKNVYSLIQKKKHTNLKLLNNWIETQLFNNFKELTLKYASYHNKMTSQLMNFKKYSIEQFIEYIIECYIINIKNMKQKNYLFGTELTHFKLTDRMHTMILEEKEQEKELEFKRLEELKKNHAKQIFNFVNLTKKRILILKKKYRSSKTSFLKYSKLNILKLLKNKKYLKKQLFKKSFKKWHIILNDFLLKKLVLSFMINGNKYKSYKRIYKILKKIKIMFGINPLYLIHSFFNKIKSIIEVNILRYKKKIIYKPKFVNYNRQIANVFRKIKEILFDSEYNKLYNIKMTYEEKFIYILIFFSLKKNYLYLTDSEKLTTKLFFNKKHLLNINIKKIKKLKKKKKYTYTKKKKNKYLEKEKNKFKKFHKYFKKYNDLKYINYNYNIKYHNKKNIQTGIYIKKEFKDKFKFVNNNIDYFEKKKKLKNKKIYYKHKKLIKKKNPLNTYITRFYNYNDYNEKIRKKKNTKKFKNKKWLKKKYNNKKKYNKKKLKKKYKFIKKFSWLNKNKTLYNKRIKKKKDLWLRHNKIYYNNKSLLKNKLLIEKIVIENDYFSELKSKKIPINKIVYKTNKFLGFKKKY